MAIDQVESRVKFISEIEPADSTALAALYSGALAYVQPSLAEGFGLPILEAMKCKTPVICSDIPVFHELVRTNATFVEPTGQAIGQAVSELIEWSPSQRRQRVSQAQRWSQRFTWDKTAKETVAVYKQVLGL